MKNISLGQHFHFSRKPIPLIL